MTDAAIFASDIETRDTERFAAAFAQRINLSRVMERSTGRQK